MIVTSEAPLAERVLGVMKALLRENREYTTDLCANLRPALLQALQRISVASMSKGLRQEVTVPGRPRNQRYTFYNLL